MPPSALELRPLNCTALNAKRCFLSPVAYNTRVAVYAVRRLATNDSACKVVSEVVFKVGSRWAARAMNGQFQSSGAELLGVSLAPMDSSSFLRVRHSFWLSKARLVVNKGTRIKTRYTPYLYLYN